MMNVCELRYIQALYEPAAGRNPDALVGAFLPMRRRLACAVRGMLLRSRLRAKPFYRYLLARTRYYDAVFLDAVHGGVRRIINIGCGSDTRAYRFAHLLRRAGVAVLECDQPQAIRAKQEIAERHWAVDHVSYVTLDLQARAWSALERPLSGEPALVMLEGVSPYISTDSFEAFLRFLAGRLAPRSVLAYDFKIAGTPEAPGVVQSMPRPFRLPAERKQVAGYHAALGFELEHMELSRDLCRRLAAGEAMTFDHDCLLRLRPGERSS
jgi:methyltransferase (TIGR00027 family)